MRGAAHAYDAPGAECVVYADQGHGGAACWAWQVRGVPVVASLAWLLHGQNKSSDARLLHSSAQRPKPMHPAHERLAH
jgi:hypothetical protein